MDLRSSDDGIKVWGWFGGRRLKELVMSSFQVRKLNELLGEMDRQLKARIGSAYYSTTLKELVFNRVRVLQAEGYVDDVAFAMALREHNFVV